MKVLALDFGTKRVGMAISDGESSIAHKYGIINYSETASLVEQVSSIVKKEEIGLVLVGRPLSLAGKVSKTTEKVDDFVEIMRQETDVEIKTVDERFTSKTAEQNVGTLDKGAIDQEAARIMLQQYLDQVSSGN